MYNQNEKDELLNELKEMESLQIDMDNEGKILQEDIIDFLLNGNGNPEDLGDRIELYLYEFKLFCRKPVRFAQKDFNVYLNAVDIPFEKLDALLKDLDKFTLVIYTEVDKGFSVLNLNLLLNTLFALLVVISSTVFKSISLISAIFSQALTTFAGSFLSSFVMAK